MYKEEYMMKKAMIILLVFMLAMTGIIGSVSASTYIKKPSQSQGRGETLYVGGIGPNNYTKIQDAITDAIDGDTVFVLDDSAPYIENVVVDKSIALLGENKETTIIDGGTTSDCILLMADRVTLQGFTLTHTTNEHYGIRVCSHENIIRDNIITNNMIGIHLLKVNNNTIEENEITHNYYGGIYQYSCDDTIISNNIISGVTQTAGVSILYDSHRALITLNTISENNYGIDISQSNDNTILNNNIMENTWGIDLDMASNNLIKQNNIQENIKPVTWVGLSWHLAKERWYRNTFDENYWGRAPILIKPILGVLVLVYNVQDNGAMGLGFNICGLVPMIKFDHHPSQEPYDIPGGI
jgi:parallel beta-helix repeat protein